MNISPNFVCFENVAVKYKNMRKHQSRYISVTRLVVGVDLLQTGVFSDESDFH